MINASHQGHVPILQYKLSSVCQASLQPNSKITPSITKVGQKGAITAKKKKGNHNE